MNEWMDGERHVARADELSESGQWDAAAEELRLAVRKCPDQDDWQFHLGLALERIQQHGEAAAVFEEVLRLRGPEVEALLHLGMNRLWAGQARRAAVALERAERLDPNRHESFCFRIAAYAELDRPEQAEYMFHRAQQIGDDCPNCYEHLGASLVRTGDARRAAWCWQHALKLDPERVHLHRILGQTYGQLGELELARHFLEEAVKFDVTDAESLLTLGIVLAEVGRPVEATERFRWAVEIQPDLALGHVYLGELAMRRGDTAAAAARFERAAEIEPDTPGAEAGLARIALLRGDHDRAREHALRGIEARGQSPVQRLEFGRLLLELNLADESLSVLDDLIAELEGDAESIRLLPDALLARGAALVIGEDLTAGLADMRRASALDPGHAVAAQCLGMVFYSLDCPMRAAVWLGRAVQLDPASPNAHRMRRRAIVRLVLARLRRRLRRLARR